MNYFMDFNDEEQRTGTCENAYYTEENITYMILIQASRYLWSIVS